MSIEQVENEISTFHVDIPIAPLPSPHTHKQPHNTQQKLNAAHSNVHISANNGRMKIIRLDMES